MKSICPNLRTYIEDQGYTAHLGRPPRGTGSPFVVLTRAAMDTAKSFDDTPDVGSETVILSFCSKATDAAAWSAEETIRALLEDFTGTLVSGGRTVKAVHVMDESDIEPERLPEDDDWWYGAELTLLIQHQA